MLLRCERKEEVRVDDFNMQKSTTVGIGTGIGGCTYAQSGVGVNRREWMR
jgi:hypothetical protein